VQERGREEKDDRKSGKKGEMGKSRYGRLGASWGSTIGKTKGLER
jgi:hypothetical protein